MSRNSKWLFAAVIAIIALLLVGIVYQFVRIKTLESQIDSARQVSSVSQDVDLKYFTYDR